jgi:hypothetical protein
MELSGQLHAPAALPPVSILYEAAWAPEPITVAARSKACTVFGHSNTWIVGSNLTRGMDVCVRLFRDCVVLCVTGLFPVQRVLPTVYELRN